MHIQRVGSRASTVGPAAWFTGQVQLDPLFEGQAPQRTSGVSVTFAPGARTAWHTHPLGQTLIVTAGCNAKVRRFVRCDRVMSLRLRRVRSIGTVRRQRPV